MTWRYKTGLKSDILINAGLLIVAGMAKGICKTMTAGTITQMFQFSEFQ
jgi:hypothetical protein